MTKLPVLLNHQCNGAPLAPKSQGAHGEPQAHLLVSPCDIPASAVLGVGDTCYVPHCFKLLLGAVLFSPSTLSGRNKHDSHFTDEKNQVTGRLRRLSETS